MSDLPAPSTAAVPAAPPSTLPLGELIALLRRIEEGDRAAESQLRALIRADPAVCAQLAGHLRTAEDSWLDAATANRPTRIALEAATLHLRTILQPASALETLLVERIAVCWLQLWRAEVATTAALAHHRRPEHITFHENLMDRAHRRYLAAIKALASLRKLPLPAISLHLEVPEDRM